MLLDATSDVTLPILFCDPSTFASAQADSLPTFRLFSTDGAVANGNGTASQLEGKAISAIAVGATTTITSTGHGLTTGAVVTISGATGTSNVNGTHQITVTDANTFTFTGSTSSGTYTSGAAWVTPGLYGLTLDSTIRAALEVGKSYTVICYGKFSTVVRALSLNLTVVA